MRAQLLLIKLITFQLCILITTGKNIYHSSTSTNSKYNVVDLIRSDGYTVDIHHIVTEDGYILELHRIPHGRNETFCGQNIRKPAVFLAHCLMCSSAAFVVLGPNGGLAYMLANSGYDVWMMNSRGSQYSRTHVKLSPKSRKFWQFSWHEQGVYDVPASIDYILSKTGESKLDAIGYSMGNTQLFVLLNERPEYNEKLRSLTAIAPAVFLGNSKQPVARILSAIEDVIVNYSVTTDQLEVPSESLGLKKLFSSICAPNIFFEKFCNKVVRFAGGRNNGNLNRRTLPFYFRFFPEPTSLRNFIHYFQLYKTGQFQKYNYGRKLNMKLYGAHFPPTYNLSKVTTPVNLLWSYGDDVTVAEDVAKLMNVLPNIISTYEVPDKSFSHVDFIWARNAHILVNEVVLQRLNMTR